MISVLILTLDEEVNIFQCIESLPGDFRGDVHVLDSGSDDLTCELARNAGATVHYNKFEDYAAQRNFGLSLPFENKWVLMLDADERVPKALATEIRDFVKDSDNEAYSIVSVRRRDMLGDQWIKRASGYPTWFPRLLQSKEVSVERKVNERYRSVGESCSLENDLEHHPFSKGLEWWFDRHNRYSTMEAEILNGEKSFQEPSFIKGSLSKRDAQRANLKRILYKLPARPFVIFLYLYFFRLGFLDGVAGYKFALMRTAYEIMIDVKK